jgi:transcriptional regulator with XRE-family HTH domain
VPATSPRACCQWRAHLPAAAETTGGGRAFRHIAAAGGATEEQASMPKKRPDPIDVHVGARVRTRRMMVGLSQEKLGDALGLTFQQVQKYEKGANRIGPSRLARIAATLGAPVAWFFEGAPSGGPAGPVTGDFIAEFMADRRGIELARLFTGLSAEARDALIAVAAALEHEGLRGELGRAPRRSAA